MRPFRRRRIVRRIGGGWRLVPDDPNAPPCPEVRAGPTGVVWFCQRLTHDDDQHFFRTSPQRDRR